MSLQKVRKHASDFGHAAWELSIQVQEKDGGASADCTNRESDEEEPLIKHDLAELFYANKTSPEASASGFSCSVSGNCALRYLKRAGWRRRETSAVVGRGHLSYIILQTRAVFPWESMEIRSLALGLALGLTSYTLSHTSIHLHIPCVALPFKMNFTVRAKAAESPLFDKRKSYSLKDFVHTYTYQKSAACNFVAKLAEGLIFKFSVKS